MYHLKISKGAEKYVKRLDKTTQRRIKDALVEISETPYTASNVRKLASKQGYRKRVGEYRIVYQIADNELEIYVIDINDRSQVYKRL